MNQRLRIVKTILWGLVGVLGVVTIARFINGLGPTTGLSDAAPWGFWIAFDVMAGVALAAGGFVLVATVYIFGLERYRPFVRPAILTAFLGYAAVATGLLYDLGLPWNIWHPMIFPQHHSVLFEVAMCVMLYLTVLALEFAPVVLEHGWFGHPLFRTVLGLVKRFTIVLVIAGIVLSTLHQSSLGSLFLIAPFRLHALWYSPVIYVLFFISAIGLGLMTVAMESLISGWLLGHKIRTDLLSGLGKAASFVLGLYCIVRLGDLAVRGVLGSAFNGSWHATLFLFEICICALVPAILLSMRRVRTSITGLTICSSMTIIGMILNRFSVCILAFDRPLAMSYFPTWIELAVSLGIVAGAALIFLFFVENLKVYSEEDESDAHSVGTSSGFNPGAFHDLMPESVAGPRRYSLVLVAAASMAVFLLPDAAVLGEQSVSTPVLGVRTVEGVKVKDSNGGGVEFMLASAQTKGKSIPLMMIDGNRDGRLVFFPHENHVKELGNDNSCQQCHHQNMPFDKNTSCFQCHSDMYEASDIFSHDSHIKHMEGNEGCVKCHDDPTQVKSRQTAKACQQCHSDMIAADTFRARPAKALVGMATGYMNAMHGLCIDCHERKIKEKPGEYSANFARCDTCHGDPANADLHGAGPYSLQLVKSAKP
jgi:Ni/Fe-hydrogenase subunit HybB-like protein